MDWRQLFGTTDEAVGLPLLADLSMPDLSTLPLTNVTVVPKTRQPSLPLSLPSRPVYLLGGPELITENLGEVGPSTGSYLDAAARSAARYSADLQGHAFRESDVPAGTQALSRVIYDLIQRRIADDRRGDTDRDATNSVRAADAEALASRIARALAKAR